jgi:hypothetical protein
MQSIDGPQVVDSQWLLVHATRIGSQNEADFLIFDIVLHNRRRPLTRGRGLKQVLRGGGDSRPRVARSHAGVD